MKLTILTLGLMAIFSSCTYQYFKVSSNQVPKNENNDFVVENDTVKVLYRFTGYHGPVQITIFNKMNEPLEIDWRKSALIMNNRASSYYTPDMVLNGTINNDSLRKLYFFNTRYINANIHADILVNEPSQFIPPSSSISKIPIALRQENLIFLPIGLKKEKLQINEYHIVKVKRAEYTVEKSPVSFRSYLTFKCGSGEGKEFSLEYKFYVSEVIQTGSGPESFTRATEEGDIFYVSQ
jgi:hypothetical protein